jgi:hypothetical protein
MVKNKLVEGLISDGAKLLRELDRQDFPVESMFWVHLPEEEYWRLVIASPFVAQRGGAAGYRRLNELMRNLEFAGITLEDVSLLDPKSPQFASLYSLACGSSRLAAGLAWLEFEDAIIYRWTGASVSANLGCEVSADELREFWEAERASLPFDHPGLLISKDAGRVTLRIHPQHGPQERIDSSIRTAFAIALHRPDARPGCQVNWLD